MPYDVLLRGGRVIDPAQGLDGVLDVAIQGLAVRGSAGGDPAGSAPGEVLDVAGRNCVTGASWTPTPTCINT